jgi:predicted ATP-dependent endonuclease of OLD family
MVFTLTCGAKSIKQGTVQGRGTMKVRWLEIEGFRGIGRIRLDLDTQLTVLVGENGAGKTSVLDALAILLDNYVARWLKGSAQSAERLRDTDVKRETRRTRLTISVTDQDATWVLRKQDRTEKILRPKGSELDGLNALVKRRVEARGDELTSEPLMI